MIFFSWSKTRYIMWLHGGHFGRRERWNGGNITETEYSSGKKLSSLIKSSSFYLGQLIFKVLYFVTIQKNRPRGYFKQTQISFKKSIWPLATWLTWKEVFLDLWQYHMCHKCDFCARLRPGFPCPSSPWQIALIAFLRTIPVLCELGWVHKNMIGDNWNSYTAYTYAYI